MASSGRHSHIDGEVHRRVPFGCYKIGRVAAGEEAKFITNAAQAMPKGGRLSLRTVQEEDKVAISVTDTGAGIPAENLEQIFDPFFSTKPAGTGLVLSVSMGIVREHGGEITVESIEGQGSTFTVWLPLECQGAP